MPQFTGRGRTWVISGAIWCQHVLTDNGHLGERGSIPVSHNFETAACRHHDTWNSILFSACIIFAVNCLSMKMIWRNVDYYPLIFVVAFKIEYETKSNKIKYNKVWRIHLEVHEDKRGFKWSFVPFPHHFLPLQFTIFNWEWSSKENSKMATP